MRLVRLFASLALCGAAMMAGTGGAATATGGTLSKPSGGAIASTAPTGVSGHLYSNTWSTGAAAMPTARDLAGAASAGGLTYVIGGCNNAISCSVPTNANEAYNLSTNSWQTKMAMPRAVGGLSVVLATNGLIYALGGYNGTAPVNTNEAYDPTHNGWAAEAPMPTPRFGMVAALGSDGLIYTFGGGTGTFGGGGADGIVEAYNPTTNQWTCSVGDSSPGCTSSTIAIPPEPTVFGAAVADGRTIYVFVGAQSTTGDLWAYNVTTNSWTQKAHAPTPRYFVGAALATSFASRVKAIYVIGGCLCLPALAVNEAYYPATNRWAEEAPIPAAQAGPAIATTASGLVQVVGGGNDAGLDGTTANELYAP